MVHQQCLVCRSTTDMAARGQPITLIRSNIYSPHRPDPAIQRIRQHTTEW